MSPNTLCQCCGKQVDPEIAQTQLDTLDQCETGDPSCRECIESVESNPQLQSLIDIIEESLNPTNSAIYQQQPIGDKILFAISCINKGHVNGGSIGLHVQLKKYSAVVLQG
jgi:hypothetical protein